MIADERLQHPPTTPREHTHIFINASIQLRQRRNGLLVAPRQLCELHLALTPLLSPTSRSDGQLLHLCLHCSCCLLQASPACCQSLHALGFASQQLCTLRLHLRSVVHSLGTDGDGALKLAALATKQ